MSPAGPKPATRPQHESRSPLQGIPSRNPPGPAAHIIPHGPYPVAAPAPDPAKPVLPASSPTSTSATFWRGLAALAHLVAAAVLALFGLSHWLVLLHPDFSDTLSSLVFPFLSNLQLHALAAGLELACATACVVYRGKSLPSLLILGLVLSMLWYHWALGFHGYRKSCGCLGYFGRLLGLPLWTDRLVPFAGLSLLALCAWPALCMRAPWPARAWLPLHPGHALHLVSHPPQRKASAVRPERLGSGCHKVFHWFVRLLLSGFNPVAARRWAVAAEALRNNNRHLRSGPSTRRNIFRAPTRTVHRIGLPGRAEGPGGCLENKTPKTEKKRP